MAIVRFSEHVEVFEYDCGHEAIATARRSPSPLPRRRRRRSLAAGGAAAAPSLPAPLARRRRRTLAAAAAYNRSLAGIHDENAAPRNDENAEPCDDGSARLRGRFGSQRRSGGLSDITNVVSDLCLDLESAKRRVGKRPVLPARLIAEILALAGFADLPMEAEYAARFLLRERRREPRFLATLGWRAALHSRDRIRAIVVDWLRDVHRDRGFQPRTLFLAVGLLDRFLERREVRLGHWLAAATAMQLASKVDEVEALEVWTIGRLCGEVYSAADVRTCEQAMLAALNFEVETPTVAEFLPFYLSACQAEANLGSLDMLCHMHGGDVAHCALRFGSLASAQDQRRNETAWHLCSTSLLDAELCRQHPPSLLAAAAVLASNRLHGSRRPWLRSLEALSGYSEAALVPCAEAMLRLREQPRLENAAL